MKLGKAIQEFKLHLIARGYSKFSQQNIWRYCHNRLPRDIFVLLPFENIFGYSGKLSFLTMGDYLRHHPEEFRWQDYVYNLPLEALDQRIVRTLWENASPGSSLRCFLRYLQEEKLLAYPLIVRRKPQWRREVEQLIKNAPSRPRTFTEGVGCYLRHLIDNQNITEQGLHGRYAQLKAALDWFCQKCGVKLLEQVELELVRGFLNYRRYERGNNPTTLYHAACALKGLFSFLAEQGYLKHNPLQELKVKRLHTVTATNVPSPAEMEALLKTAQQEVDNCRKQNTLRGKELLLATRNRAILLLLCTTGLRSSELLSLTLEQLDYSQGCVRVLGKGNSRYAKKERKVFLGNPKTVDALAAYLRLRPKGYGPRLFLTRNGLPMSPQDLRRIVKKYAELAGLSQEYPPHKLRAGFASMLVSQGIDPLTLKELMGHDSIKTTLKCYTSLDEEHLRNVWKNCNPLSRLRQGKVEDDA